MEDCGRFLSLAGEIVRKIAEDFCPTPGQLNGTLQKFFSESELIEGKIAEDFSQTLGKLNGRLRKIFVLLLAN